MVHRNPALIAAAFQPPFHAPGTAQSSTNTEHLSYLQKHALCPCDHQSRNKWGFQTHETFKSQRRTKSLRLHGKKSPKDDNEEKWTPNHDSDEGDSDGYREFLEQELARVESLQDILEELEAFDADGEDDDAYLFEEWDEETLDELFSSLSDDEEDDDGDGETYLDLENRQQSASLLENALLQGVVPVDAGVGSDRLPGDFGFDPLNLAKKDYFRQAQAFLMGIVPVRENKYADLEVENEDANTLEDRNEESPRPQALILRDYREAEIRHGRLAMLAVFFWPLQELLDRLVLDEEQFDSLLLLLFSGGVTLPYFPLLMTGIMLLLGYLDIYSQAIKDMDKIGEAFLPGDCFWDPLQILTGAPDRMKRNMQERELFNGRFAMLAFAVFVWEEATTGLPLVSVEGNELLFEPVYTVPFVQEWLDDRFSTPSPVFFYRFPDDELVDSLTTVDLLLAKSEHSLHGLF